MTSLLEDRIRREGWNEQEIFDLRTDLVQFLAFEPIRQFEEAVFTLSKGSLATSHICRIWPVRIAELRQKLAEILPDERFDELVQALVTDGYAQLSEGSTQLYYSWAEPEYGGEAKTRVLHQRAWNKPAPIDQ